MTRAKCKIIDLPKMTGERGSLTFLEAGKEAPFDIKRVYYLYDVPNEQLRGAHAHIELMQVLVAVNGSLDVMVDDGNERMHYKLDKPNQGLFVPPMYWRELSNFSEGAVCLVLASDFYRPEDYIYTYEEFKNTFGK